MTQRYQIRCDCYRGDRCRTICSESDLLRDLYRHYGDLMKQFLRVGIYICLAFSRLPTFAFDTSSVTDTPPIDNVFDTPDPAEATDLGTVFKETAIDDTAGAVEGISAELQVAYVEPQRASEFLRNVINRALGITGLIALIMIIYGFYKMFAAKDNEEAAKGALKIIISATIALLVIAVVWFLVSWFFDTFFEVIDNV